MRLKWIAVLAFWAAALGLLAWGNKAADFLWTGISVVILIAFSAWALAHGGCVTSRYPRWFARFAFDEDREPKR